MNVYITSMLLQVKRKKAVTGVFFQLPAASQAVATMWRWWDCDRRPSPQPRAVGRFFASFGSQKEVLPLAFERLSPLMRDNCLSNRVFLNSEDLVGHGCDAWNKLEAQQWRMMSIGLRDRARRF
ncbi:MAG: hypothetical protein NT133_00180 [Alphaproteobacteria bacterium]|nr:hypothetical protein [Alphaproteobacteria bacterium]